MTTPIKTLPASWYRSKPLYELEQRAIFLKAWYLLGPVTRFKDHDKVSYEMAGVEFAVENITNNPRSGDDSSSSSSSHLLKVSRVADEHPLPHKLTSSGLLFAAISPDAPSFEDYFPGLEGLLARVDFTKLPFKRTLSYEGRFNWKTMVDGYQECLHCQYTHKSFSQLYPPTFYTVHNHGHYSRHFVTEDQESEDGLFLYFFPNCTLNVYGGGMTSFRVCPILTTSSSSLEGREGGNEENDGAGGPLTRMEFDYYHQTPADSESFAQYFKFVRRVAMEDYELCERAQENLEKGVYTQGVLNPDKEGGVIHYQGLVRERVIEMFRKEEEEDEQRQREEEEEEGRGLVMGREERGGGEGQLGAVAMVGG